MASVALPSLMGATTIEQIVDRVESIRKEIEFLFNNLDGDNITNVTSQTIDWKTAGTPPAYPSTSDEIYNKSFTTHIDDTNMLTQNIYGSNIFGNSVKANYFFGAHTEYPILFYAGNTDHLRMGITDTFFYNYDKDGNRYWYADKNGAILNNEDVATRPWVLNLGYASQTWVQNQGYVTVAGDVSWHNTYSIQRGGASIKFLYGSATVQARSYADDAYGTFEGLAYSNVSRRELKKDIEPYANDALQEVMDTQVYAYRYNTDLDTEPKRVGLIFDEAPLEIMMFSGGVDIYGMAAMLWKAVQQLKQELNEWKGAS